MNHAELIQKILAKRDRWVDLAPGKRVCVRRPGQVQQARLYRMGVTVENLAACAVSWEGITAQDVLGDDAAQGLEGAAAETARGALVTFHPDLWALVVEDNAEWAAKCSKQVLDLIKQYGTDREDTGKNSPPSSTLPPTGEPASS